MRTTALLAAMALVLAASGCSRNLRDITPKDCIERDLLCQDVYRASQRYLKVSVNVDPAAIRCDLSEEERILVHSACPSCDACFLILIRMEVPQAERGHADRLACLLDLGAGRGLRIPKEAFSKGEARFLTGLYDSRMIAMEDRRRREIRECLEETQ
jgi:hypothetical protein